MDLSNYKLPIVQKPKPGEPRCIREELLDKFLVQINECRKQGGFQPITFGRLTKMLKGYKDDQLQWLYDDCTAPGVRSFTALLTFKLKPRAYTKAPKLPDPSPSGI